MENKFYSSEVKEFIKGLAELGLYFEVKSIWDGVQVISRDGWDCICHSSSYGGESGLMEFYGDILRDTPYAGDVVGYVNAVDGLKMVKTYYNILDN